MTAAAQLPLSLPARPARGRADFFVSASNATAAAQLSAWRGPVCALIGPEGAGKSHLAAVWAAETGAAIVPAGDLASAEPAALAAPGAVAVEDADRGLTPAGERALFHLHNRLAAAGGALLLTGRTAPGRWRVALPDLASRLAAAPVARLEAPDDALLEALAVKLFADRGVLADPGLPRFLAQRGPRSHAGLAQAVAALDREALARRARLTVRFARPLIQRMAEAEGDAPGLLPNMQPSRSPE